MAKASRQAAVVSILEASAGIYEHISVKRNTKQQRMLNALLAQEKSQLTQRQLGQTRDLQRQAALSQKIMSEVQLDIEKAMTKQQAGVAVAQTRSRRQVARTSGLGGSFAQVSGAESEIQFQLEQRLDAINRKGEVAEQQRVLRAKGESLTYFQNLERSIFEANVGILDADVTAAQQKRATDVQFTNTMIGAAGTAINAFLARDTGGKDDDDSGGGGGGVNFGVGGPQGSVGGQISFQF